MSNANVAEVGTAGFEMVSPLIAASEWVLPANINACAISADGAVAAAALGDGRLAFIGLERDGEAGGARDVASFVSVAKHSVAAVGVKALADGFVSAGQDGGVVFTPAHEPGAGKPLWYSDGDWIEVLTVHDAAGLVGIASGKCIVVLDADGSEICSAKLDETVSGLAFDHTGRRIAASHYGGASILSLPDGKLDVGLAWKGAHIGVAWSPDDRYIVTATQERELHGWDLVTMKDFRMGGYPRKTHQMCWTADGELLACSGADVVTAWSFAGSGPGGRPPVEIGFVFGATVTSVASRPSRNHVAAGFSSGNVLIGATGKGEALVARARTGTEVTSLAWSPCGRRLAAGDRRGHLAMFDVPAELPVR